MNSLPPKTVVTGSSRERRTVLQVNYSASMDQVRLVFQAYTIKYYRFQQSKSSIILKTEQEKVDFFLKKRSRIYSELKKGFGMFEL